MVSLLFFFFLMIRRPPRSTLFPTRRSSDLLKEQGFSDQDIDLGGLRVITTFDRKAQRSAVRAVRQEDRKSTRLNSSHSQISYAVFCLKKKKNYTNMT